jgi:hypothetical protein
MCSERETLQQVSDAQKYVSDTATRVMRTGGHWKSLEEILDVTEGERLQLLLEAGSWLTENEVRLTSDKANEHQTEVQVDEEHEVSDQVSSSSDPSQQRNSVRFKEGAVAATDTGFFFICVWFCLLFVVILLLRYAFIRFCFNILLVCRR